VFVVMVGFGVIFKVLVSRWLCLVVDWVLLKLG